MAITITLAIVVKIYLNISHAFGQEMRIIGETLKTQHTSYSRTNNNQPSLKTYTLNLHGSKVLYGQKRVENRFGTVLEIWVRAS